MSELVAIVYPTEDRAREVLQTLCRLEAAHLLDLEDACYVTKDARGRVELHQSINVTARGALGGAFWGSLIGLIDLRADPPRDARQGGDGARAARRPPRPQLAVARRGGTAARVLGEGTRHLEQTDRARDVIALAPIA